MDAITARIVRCCPRKALLAIAGLLLPAASAAAQTTLPFGVGERLTYQVRVDKMRASGRGTMWIEGPVFTKDLRKRGRCLT